jgi:hypothetical protein
LPRELLIRQGIIPGCNAAADLGKSSTSMNRVSVCEIRRSAPRAVDS